MHACAYDKGVVMEPIHYTQIIQAQATPQTTGTERTRTPRPTEPERIAQSALAHPPQPQRKRRNASEERDSNNCSRRNSKRACARPSVHKELARAAGGGVDDHPPYIQPPRTSLACSNSRRMRSLSYRGSGTGRGMTSPPGAACKP